MNVLICTNMFFSDAFRGQDRKKRPKGEKVRNGIGDYSMNSLWCLSKTALGYIVSRVDLRVRLLRAQSGSGPSIP